MTLIPVDGYDRNHIQFLYELLKERPACANISHKGMPTMEQHKKFVRSNPYRYWFLIEGMDGGSCIEDGAAPCFVGSVYLTNHDEIGIFIKAEYQGQGYAKEAINMMEDMVRPGRILANISPNNGKSMHLFTKLGYKLIQNTYEKIV